MHVMKSIEDRSITACITDIPYGEVSIRGSERAKYAGQIRSLDKGCGDYPTFNLNEFISEVCRVTNGSIYIFCGTEQVSEIRRELSNNKFSTRLIIWEKTNPSPMNGDKIWLSGIECCVYGKRSKATFNAHCRNTVFRYPCGRNKLHPTQKPIELIKDFIEVSTNIGDLVIDPCMGSGTTGVACRMLEREFIGVELNTDYFEIAKKRIQEV